MKDALSEVVRLLTLGISLLFLANCQDENKPEVNIGKDGILASDPLAKLMQAVTSKDGSMDNIIDRSSCTTVKFPIRGVLEDVEMEFDELEDVEALGAGALEVDWIFPINAILSDHTEVTIGTEGEMKEIQENCIEGGNDPDNECIDFLYPFTIQVFDMRTENVATEEMTDDKAAYTTFTSTDLITTVEYPVKLIDFEGNLVQTTTNEEMTASLSASVQTCDEQDIVEFEKVFEEELRALFTSVSWLISLYEENGNNNTIPFSGYTLQFREDLTLQAQGPEVIGGEWEVDLLDTGSSVSIEFDTDDPPLILLNANWTVVSYDQTQINMELERVAEGIKRLQLTSD